MFASGIISITLEFTCLKDILFHQQTGLLPEFLKFPLVVCITTIIWLLVTFLTKPEDKTVLYRFYKKIQPGGRGWKKVVTAAQKEGVTLHTEKGAWSVPSGILAMLWGLVMIYALMFSTGNFIYGNLPLGFLLLIFAALSAYFLVTIWEKIKINIL